MCIVGAGTLPPSHAPFLFGCRSWHLCINKIFFSNLIPLYVRSVTGSGEEAPLQMALGGGSIETKQVPFPNPVAKANWWPRQSAHTLTGKGAGCVPLGVGGYCQT